MAGKQNNRKAQKRAERKKAKRAQRKAQEQAKIARRKAELEQKERALSALLGTEPMAEAVQAYLHETAEGQSSEQQAGRSEPAAGKER